MKTIEEATGLCPVILAAMSVDRLAEILQCPKLLGLRDKVADIVAKRAVMHWSSNEKYRKKWTRQPALLRSFFQHWACSAALSVGIDIPDSVKSNFGNGS